MKVLRNVARSYQSDMLSVGVHNMMLHHISFMDSFIFDHHFNRSRTRRHRHLALGGFSCDEEYLVNDG